MPGPCSMPNGTSKTEYEEQWFKLCDFHKDCTPDNHREYDKYGEPVPHMFITKREWLARRKRLRTGKTV